MELWKDQQTNQFYLLDVTTGKRFICDQFGKRQQRFRTSFTGFATAEMRKKLADPTAFPNLQTDPSRLYTAQPKKFDGYFQCPRPASTPFFNDLNDPTTLKPYKPGKMPSNRLPDDLKKIPRPINHLTFSRVYDKSQKPKKEISRGTSVKALSSSQSFVKTAADLEKSLKYEKVMMRGYVPPPEKPPRRHFKNYFGLKYKTSNDQFADDKAFLRLTNPLASAHIREREAFEAKTMEKRHQAAALKDKIMMGG